jgi:hypothetical protein
MQLEVGHCLVQERWEGRDNEAGCNGKDCKGVSSICRRSKRSLSVPPPLLTQSARRSCHGTCSGWR